jgi:hypothetical protein
VRIPDRNPKQFFTDKPIFAGQRNGLITCSVCGWDCAGPRSNLKFAWNEHWRMNHSQEVAPVFIREAQQQQIIIPTGVRQVG